MPGQYNYNPVNSLYLISELNYRDDISKLLDNTLKEVVFDKLNGFQRKLIYGLIERHFSTTVSTSTRNIENNRKALVVELKKTEEEEMVIDATKKEKDLKYMNESIGLRLLMKEISRSVCFY